LSLGRRPTSVSGQTHGLPAYERGALGLRRGQPLDGERSSPSGWINDGPGNVQLSLVQGFTLTRDGQVIALPMGAQRLMALLALQERPMPRPYVSGILWLDAPDDRARANLRSALWRLRYLGDPLIERVGDDLCIASKVVVDVRQAVALARRVLTSAGLDELALEVFASGDLLPGWYDDWVLIERERFRQLRLHVLEFLCQRLAAVGRFQAAVEAGLTAVAAEPLRESAHRALIRAHLAEGNRVEAIRQYRLYRELVREELGIDPTTQMEDLIRMPPWG
jgi:DNA-binding SARP family transcriptional activator